MAPVGGNPGVTGYFTNRMDGLWTYVPESPDRKMFLVFKYEALAGDTYGYGVDGKIAARVVSTDATATVPAGVFEHCYQYEFKPQGRTTTTLIWMLPGVGKILEQDPV